MKKFLLLVVPTILSFSLMAQNVGIGTANPNYKLDVNGSFRTANSNLTLFNDYIYVSPTNNNTLNSGYNSNSTADLWINYRGYQDGFTQPRNFNIGDGQSNNIAWFDGVNHRMSINNGQTANYTLDVNGNIGAQYIATTDNSVGSGVTGIMVKAGDNNMKTGTAAAVLSFLGVTAPTGDNLGNHTATTTLQMSGHPIANTPTIDITSGNGNGIRFWSSDDNKISMGNGADYLYGPVNDYSLKTNASNIAGRGWTWGVVGVTPVAALEATAGNFQVKGNVTASANSAEMGTHPNYSGFTAWWKDGQDYSLLTNASNTYLNAPAASGNIYLRTANADKMFIQGSNGYVGIGTTAPGAPLEVRTPNLGVNDVSLRLRPVGSSGSSTSIVSVLDMWSTFDNFTADQGPRRTASIRAGFSGGTWGKEYLSFHVGGATDAASLPSEKMRILANGNVGIGTTSPGAALDVRGTKIDLNGSTSDVQGLSLQTQYVNGNTNSRIFFRETNDNLYGFSWLYAGNPNPTLDGTAFTLATNYLYLIRHNNSTTGNVVMAIDRATGNVGIGDNNPTRGKLVVDGTGSTQYISYNYLAPCCTSVGNIQNAYVNYSIYATGRIASAEFDAYSDARIKNIKDYSNSAEDLNTLSKIKITDYTMKDSIGEGKKPYKKVIAQQVEQVYPLAVSKTTGVVPDIYQVSEMKNGFVALKTNLKTGDRVKLITADKDNLYSVTQVSDKGFQVASDYSGKVFVYGREVHDFRSVDYDAISMLNVSATQELLKRLEKLEKENSQLKADAGETNRQLNQLKSSKADVLEVNQLKAQISDLKQLMQQNGIRTER